MNAMQNMFLRLMFTTASVFFLCSTAAAEEKLAPKLKLSYVKHMGGAYEIKARAYAKNGNETVPCTGICIGFYTDADYEKLYKKLGTNEMGEATLLMDERGASQFKDSAGHFKLYAQIEKNDKYKSKEADISALNAAIDVNFKQEGDSVKILGATIMLYDEATKKMIPGVKVPLKCFVKRALCLLPVGKDLNYTNDSGQVQITFPNDIPGDKDGHLIVVVKLDEDDNYGTVQYEKIVKWGVPLIDAENPLAGRSLISPGNNAPWVLVVVISSALIAIWGYLCFIVYGLIRIKKLGQFNAQ
jgi:hypothetical protein